ncbi:hypothetical protein B5S31_g5798 [[Candida] boidinii]|nr:hypothetical protein B5S29_g2695 [[Candida] boidinii]OWB75805.1 hypothetical protein B5S31_g5798 [[Candida] boidinii]OWB81321.1 hypothetical protein B5S32_g5734 [[Candida] boidinii]GME86202.1 unnamed protein product [[Candida] boidinii]
MSTTGQDKRDLLKQPLHGIYIPSALFIFGVAIQRLDYVPYAIAILAIILGIKFGYVYLNSVKSLDSVEWTKFELIDKTVVSKNSAIYRFKLGKDDERLTIPIGHHLACKVNIEDKDEIRYYTPISNQYDEGFFDILVKSYKDGKVSKFFASLNPGNEVEFRGPVGRMSYVENMSKNLVMIAGGSGITPMLQVIGYITTTPEDLTNMTLIYANETENDILLKEELDEFSKSYPNFKLVYVLNKPKDSNWDEGYTGLITKELLSEYLPKDAENKENKIFICGPLEMKKQMLNYCEELGYEKGTLKSDQNDQVFCF